MNEDNFFKTEIKYKIAINAKAPNTIKHKSETLIYIILQFPHKSYLK